MVTGVDGCGLATTGFIVTSWTLVGSLILSGGTGGGGGGVGDGDDDEDDHAVVLTSDSYSISSLRLDDRSSMRTCWIGFFSGAFL